jgi:hypothetical protein
MAAVARFQRMVVAGPGTAWILDGLEVTMVILDENQART